MTFFSKKADPARVAVDRQVQASFILGLLFLLAPFLIRAQYAAHTSISQVPNTDIFNLSFTQPTPPLALAGVEFFVVVQGSDPSISLQVPDNSWIFDVGETILDVGSPTIDGDEYRFPITAWRDDNEPQSGSGLYLRVIATDGIVIAVEDFPTKQYVVQPACTPGATMTTPVDFTKVIEIRIQDIQGHLLHSFQSGDAFNRFDAKWKELPHGIYLITAVMSDNSIKSWKALR